MKFLASVLSCLALLNVIRAQDSELYTIDDGCEIPYSISSSGVISSPPQSGGTVYLVGEAAFFTCDTGMELEGPVFAFCQQGGIWSATFPKCVDTKIYVEIGCEPPVVEHGVYVTSLPTGKKRFQVGDNVNVNCVSGYARQGRDFLTCLPGGFWDDYSSSCKAIKRRPSGCSAPHFDLSTGTYTPPYSSGVYPVGTKLTFVCKPGLILRGFKYGYCRESGKWNEVPKCHDGCHTQEIKNGFLTPAPVAGKKTYKFGQTVKVECNSGYRIVGSETAKCSDRGVWSNFLQCADVCDAPQKPHMTTLPVPIEGANLYKNGDNITFRCDRGYKLVGAKKIQCLHGNKWNKPVPSCEVIRCDAPAYTLATYKPVSVQYNLGSKIKWVCKQGYVLKNGRYSTCTVDGVFKPSGPVCKVSTKIDLKPKQPGRYIITRGGCMKPKVPAGGYIKPVKSFYLLASEVEFGCKKGYIMSGIARATCRQNNGFGTIVPTCKRIKCSDPRKPVNGDFLETKKDAYYYGDKVKYICNQNHIMYGSDVTECKDNAQFSPFPPDCQPHSCRFECKYVEGRPCQCNAACRIIGDCCDDFEQFCRKLFY